MTRKILLPIDLGDADTWRNPLTEALAMMGADGILHVVSVLPDFGMPQVSGFFSKGYEKEALNAFAKGLADWTTANVPEDVTVHPHVLHGTIYDEVLRAAQRLDVDIIVMGAHRPALKDYLLGPNVARVVRHATCSVYVVRE